MKLKIKLRKVKTSDKKYFAKWWRDKELLRVTSGILERIDDVEVDRYFSKIILSNNYHYLILAGDNVIGHISLVSRRGNWYETAIIIEKKWQGRGFGTEAINVLLKKAKRLGIKKVYLEVRPNNLMAIRAYEKCGLKKNGIKIYPKNKYLSKTIKMAINL